MRIDALHLDILPLIDENLDHLTPPRLCRNVQRRVEVLQVGVSEVRSKEQLKQRRFTRGTGRASIASWDRDGEEISSDVYSQELKVRSCEGKAEFPYRRHSGRNVSSTLKERLNGREIVIHDCDMQRCGSFLIETRIGGGPGG